MTEQEWLNSDSHKIILVDISYHDGTNLNTKYFGTYPYIQNYGETFVNILGDTVSSIAYEDIVLDVSKITTKINSSKSIGNITLLNTDGEYDNLLNISNSWEGHTIKIYIGAPTWSRAQFILILEGVVDSFTAPQPHLLAIAVTDKKEVLNVVSQEAILWNDSDVLNYLNDNVNTTGLYDKFPLIFVKQLFEHDGTYIDFDTSLGVIPTGNENSVIPICLGKVFNIEPLLIDAYNHVYQIHECPDTTNYGISEVTEVRANGVKLTGINDFDVDTLVSGTGGTPVAGLTITNIVNNTITVAGADFTSNGYSRAVIHNTTLNEARYVVSSSTSTTVDVDTNANNQDAAVAGWTTAHTYDIWYPTTAPTVNALQYEENLLSGCIRLLVHAQSTQITCDIIGQVTRTHLTTEYVIPDIVPHSAAFIMEYLVLEKTSLVVNSNIDTDICPHTFSPTGTSAFTNTDSLGIYIKDSNTILNLITEVITSVGGYLRFERVCVLQIFRFVDPLFETSLLDITSDDIKERGVSVKTIELPEKSINLGFSKNWTVQDKGAIAASVVESDNLTFLDQITTEFSNIVEYTGLTNTEYPLLTDAEITGTLIFSRSDAQTEATRRALLRNKKRYIYKIDTISAPFTLNIGDVIHITHSRYNFIYPGINVIIIGMEEYPTDRRVILEVWG